jgi:23S rRNA-/tRNA-specific pseudouridylate synthase
MAVSALKATSEGPTTFHFVVPKEHARMRIDHHLVTMLPELSRSRIQQLIRSGFVRLNGTTTRPNEILRTGDQIELTIHRRKKSRPDRKRFHWRFYSKTTI